MANKIRRTSLNDWPEKMKHKTLVFSVNAGRSGSKSLQKILDICPEVKAMHEPPPAFHDCAIHARQDPFFAKDFWEFLKLPAISKYPERIYVETSHLFAKGFIEPLIDIGICPKVIFIRRPAREIAMSFMRIRSIPGAEKKKWQRKQISFLLDPIKEKVLLNTNGWQRFSDYQKCFWYALEMQQRQILYKEILGDKYLEYFSCNTSDLSNVEKCIEIIEFIGANAESACRESLNRICQYKFNQKENKKVHELSSLQDIDSQEAFVFESLTSVERKQALDRGC